jgi:hypothetical protein
MVGLGWGDEQGEQGVASATRQRLREARPAPCSAGSEKPTDEPTWVIATVTICGCYFHEVVQVASSISPSAPAHWCGSHAASLPRVLLARGSAPFLLRLLRANGTLGTQRTRNSAAFREPSGGVDAKRASSGVGRVGCGAPRTSGQLSESLTGAAECRG